MIRRRANVALSSVTRRWYGSLSTRVTEDFEFREEVGTGTFASVFRVRSRVNGKLYSAKRVPKYICGYDAGKEASLLRLVQHPNVLKYICSYEDSTHHYIITEHCSGGELFDRIVSKGVFSEKSASNLISEIVRAIFACNQLSIAHRDIKPENLLYKNESDGSPVCLIDFGAAEMYDQNQHMHRFVGSPVYVAPEVLLEDYTHKCDIWSAGVILYELLCGKSPWKCGSARQTAQRVLSDPINLDCQPWDRISNDGKDLILQMLDRNPETRISASQVLQHPWVVEYESRRDDHLIEAIQNMSRFQTYSKMKRVALIVAAQLIKNRSEADSLREVFHMVDADNDGVLSLEEISSAMGSVEPNNVASRALNQASSGNDTKPTTQVDIDEFLTAAANHNQLLRNRNLLEVFHELDRNGNGKISGGELLESVTFLSKQEADELVERASWDHRDEIGYMEFVKAIRATPSNIGNNSTQPHPMLSHRIDCADTAVPIVKQKKKEAKQ